MRGRRKALALGAGRPVMEGVEAPERLPKSLDFLQEGWLGPCRLLLPQHLGLEASLGTAPTARIPQAGQQTKHPQTHKVVGSPRLTGLAGQQIRLPVGKGDWTCVIGLGEHHQLQRPLILSFRQAQVVLVELG